MTSSPPNFLVDTDLFPLCHALRMLGFDALHAGNLTLKQALDHALEEHRVWVRKRTDRLPLQYGIRYFLVSSEKLVEQLHELDQAFLLRDQMRPLSRCLKCNAVITELPVVQAQKQVPPGILKIHHEFYQCPLCRRIYWPGSHWKRMQERLVNWGF